jgi:uncharacterized protein Yka (UPF0111/DUF47 family)
VSALFAGNPDPIDVIRWKAIYHQFEEALGACEEVTNALESIALKHA